MIEVAVRLTALRILANPDRNLTLTCDLDYLSPASYCHEMKIKSQLIKSLA